MAKRSNPTQSGGGSCCGGGTAKADPQAATTGKPAPASTGKPGSKPAAATGGCCG